MAFELSVTVTGHTVSDLETALDEIKRLIGEEYQSGSNSNDTGSFYFDRTGEGEELFDMSPDEDEAKGE